MRNRCKTGNSGSSVGRYYYVNILAAYGRRPAGCDCPGGACRAVELKVSRDALQRTLRQQLFGGPEGHYFLKGRAGSGCFVYADDAQLTFAPDRILVQIRTHARLGQAVGGACLGISLTPISEVSLEPYGEGEFIGFRDAQLRKVSDHRELNFLLAPS